MAQQRIDQTIVVRQGKSSLVLGVLCLIVAVPLPLFLTVLALLAEEWPLALSMGLLSAIGTLLGILLLLVHRNQRFELEGWTCRKIDFLDREKSFCLTEVATLRVQHKPRALFLRLQDDEGKTLVTLDYSVPGCLEVLFSLWQKQIPTQGMPRWLENMLQNLKNGQDPYGVMTEQDFAENGEYEPGWQPIGFEYSHRQGISRGVWLARLVAMLLLAIAFYLLFNGHPRIFCLLLAAIPLLFFGLYMAFPRVIAWEKPSYADTAWKKGHIGFPFVSCLLAPLLGLYFINLVLEMCFVHPWQALLFGCVLLALMAGLLLWRTPKKRRGISNIIIILFLSLFFTLSGTFLLNYGLPLAPVEHQLLPATGSFQGKPANHSVVVQYQGRSYDFNASASQFQTACQTKTAKVCVQKSVFGIEYLRLH